MKTFWFLALPLFVYTNTLIADSIAKPYCAETIIDVGVDEITPLGFSARDLIRHASGRHNLDWTWEYKPNTETNQLNLTVASAARTARFIDSVAVYPNGAAEVYIICADRVEVDAWVSFNTIGGEFDEHWFTTLFDTDGTDCMPEIGDLCLVPGSEAQFIHRFDHNTMRGTFYDDVVIPDDVTVDFYARGNFSNDAISVSVDGKAYSCSNDACYAYFIHGGRTPTGGNNSVEF